MLRSIVSAGHKQAGKSAQAFVLCFRAMQSTGMDTLISTVVIVFIVAYAAIALEHPLKINKSASALVGAGVLWTVYAAFGGDHELISNQLDASVTTTAKIVFFL